MDSEEGVMIRSVGVSIGVSGGVDGGVGIWRGLCAGCIIEDKRAAPLILPLINVSHSC